ncbi:prolyl 3-hydroxylase 1 [Plakobranchus ocellatus]|uniref:procollagen-proline 3-dioxygenase n=1 Tax=Plakobranchus ocellatus TaxID=259542 RepID=A0AAV4D673_9GAST|nr:prolyl 3-hydroxylase 1 [Plakobranchus ocellatus]
MSDPLKKGQLHSAYSNFRLTSFCKHKHTVRYMDRCVFTRSTLFVISLLTLLSLINSCLSLDSSSAGEGVKIEQKLNLDLNSQIVSIAEEPQDESAQLPSKSFQKIFQEFQSKTIMDLYDGGVKAYENQLWYSCASKLERAVSTYKLTTRIISNCRLNCKKDPSQSKLYNVTSEEEIFQHVGFLLKIADCLRNCLDESLGVDYKPLPSDYVHLFETRMPYQYLQYCYYKLDQPKKAAAASYTYFLANHEDPDNTLNVVYYRDELHVPESDFQDLERAPYKAHYGRALRAYVEEDWKSVISHVEQTLEEYYLEYERCFSDCEGKEFPIGQEFSTGVTDWLVYILACKMDCPFVLNKIYTETIENFLQDMYHYLQFAYFHVQDYEKAAEATETYLLFDSSSEIMQKNKEILKAKDQVRDEDFKPRQEVVDYLKSQEDIHSLVRSMRAYRLPNEANTEVKEPLESLAEQQSPSEDWMSRYEQHGMHLIAKSVDLNRQWRFVSDGLFSGEKCEEIFTLIEGLKKGPHGSEIFDLKRAQQKLKENLDEEYEASLGVLVRAIGIVRQYTMHYFDPETPYVIKKSSLVCWSSSDKSEEKLDCYPQEDGTCVKADAMPQELTSNLYTTVTYLHSADEDGDFVFLNEDMKADRTFGLKCGRTVGFSTGDRHTLKIPKDGSKRCAMVLKYSKDPKEEEKDYTKLIILLHKVDQLRMASASQQPEVIMKRFADAGVKIVKEAKELKAKERFVADKVASEAQCSTLINMVLSAALVGDGYIHLQSKPSAISPHTEHEMFRGVTIYRAGKLAHEDVLPVGALRDFLELSENSRLLVEKYFNLTKPLYFDFTHLVCRTAVDDSNKKREDLSHPVHADNCVLKPDGSCVKEYPAFIERDYSALLYLNDDFDGGEFFFAHSNKTEQVSIRPTCGRLVGFNAGHFHGVRAVKSGTRCALALWFTLDPYFKELAHVVARKALNDKEEQQRQREKAAHEDL